MGSRIIIVVALILALSGCKVKQVQTQGTSEVKQIAHEVLRDSTRHKYKLEVITIYNEVGGIERVEERSEGDIQYRTRYVRDTTYIHVIDTLYLAKGDSAPIDSSVIEVKRDTNTTARWWAVAVIIIAVAVIIYVLGKRN